MGSWSHGGGLHGDETIQGDCGIVGGMGDGVSHSIGADGGNHGVGGTGKVGMSMSCGGDVGKGNWLEGDDGCGRGGGTGNGLWPLSWLRSGLGSGSGYA